jgi:ppGpp synthetase/RelA/SpoT-type nucleotidyltranferase
MRNIPDYKKLQELFQAKKPLLDFLLSAVQEQLSLTINLSAIPTYKGRIKDFHGYYKKFLKTAQNGCDQKRRLPADELPLITDLMGIRIVCAFLEDLSAVEHQIAQNFTVLEVERKGSGQTFREFGYESVHLLMKIPPSILNGAAAAMPGDIPSRQWLEELVCEIQIRTILQDAWAEVEHELIYKSEFSPFDLPLRRKLASINASLTLADIVFQEIRDYQNKLNSEIDFRRSAFYSKTDVLSRGNQGDTPLPVQSVPSPFVRGTIDDLLLEAIHAHNSGNFEQAVDIYTRIIHFEPPPNNVVLSVIYKHRGMAHFAKSNYDDALSDFEQSIAHNDGAFRSMYYMGIVYSLQGNYQKAIEYFDKSLDINNYQAHVHYRKAACLFKLGAYQESLSHLDISRKLGLENDDTKTLRTQLVKKFDMKV